MHLLLTFTVVQTSLTKMVVTRKFRICVGSLWVEISISNGEIVLGHPNWATASVQEKFINLLKYELMTFSNVIKVI